MNCEQAEELLGAYALDALPDEEMADVRAHLASCEEHAAKARELRAAAMSLSASVEPMTPPAGLRHRLAAAIEAETASGPTAARPVAPTLRSEARPRRPWIPASPAWGTIAAALLFAVIGLAAWNISLQDRGSSPDVLAVRPLLQYTGATAGYAVMFDDGTMAVRGDALPRLDSSQAYQLWALTDAGEARSLGLLDYDGSGVPVADDIDFDDESVRAIAITIEPAGGSEQPTGDPLYVTET